MKNKISLLIGFLFILCGFSMQIKGQEKIIRGMITTFDSIPVMKASVKVKRTKQVVYSDSLGHFSIPCKVGDKLQFTAKGFNTYNVNIDTKIRYIFVNLLLKPGPENVEYAIGYGHVKERDKIYAISSLKNGVVDFSLYNNMFELIKGRFPGVSVENGEIIIRGQRSINSSNAALIVVDGMVVDNSYLSLIPPNNVASVDVLKDAASSIYGSRGANGVVIIETKHGGTDYNKKP
jgi:TonB-dependent SusC/RagA subfamily outer membrane receptor